MSLSYYDTSYPPNLWAPADLASLNPLSVVVNTPTPVTITGLGFTPSSRVHVDGDYYPTDYLSPSQVRFVALADTVGSQDVSVWNGSAESDTLTLAVTATAEEPETATRKPPEAPSKPQDAVEAPEGTGTAQEAPEAPEAPETPTEPNADEG